ncbi:type VI secretion system Vgr family protein [Sphingomonas immobilis]|uniref:Type VI secretion system tip protein TssI/VgrG n=1 Tax=Sphingomonas immobilis TaxID=3063997 RepID=A0ABT9A429_9SPHN|nr:type VI secretion system tip protein TssI/VgrG [Sphingomonas sp. CA1-15]MDO7844588.1 type VI secretion system tip protein TssI/VgrG [Sphingomonas sp. CA1-15]
MSIDLGDEQVDLESIECIEALSTQFTIMVDVLATLEVDLHPHLGKACSLSVKEDGKVLRYFHGLLVSGDYHSEGKSGHRYRLTLKPFAYFMSQNRDMAIFQNKNALDIIKDVFKSSGISDVEYECAVDLPMRLYCVQYQESDFAFISRLMEEEGIYYFFRHEKDRHVMVLCDAPHAHKDGKPASLVYNPQAKGLFAAESEDWGKGQHFLQSWHERVSTTGEAKVTIRDFDFKVPDKPLHSTKSGELEHPNDNREVYHYPGRFSFEQGNKEDQETIGQDRSERLLHGMRSQRRVFTGTSQASGLSVGTKMTISKHEEVPRMEGAYLITSTYHSIAAETYRTGEMMYEDEFNVRFEAIPAATFFQPPHVTPRPVVTGLESAVVTGPTGWDDIYTDEFGRVKVRFHWDRANTPGEKSTCWIRVSQTGGLGNLILPRIGHEVLVDFLGGDPDRPLVVGRVFNKSNMPIYKLPEEKTKALWATKTWNKQGDYPDTMTLDSGDLGRNEIRFDDNGGKEEIFIHANRDMKTRVRYQESHHVGNDQEIKIGKDRNEEVMKNETVKIHENRTSKIDKSETLDIGENQKLTILGAQTTEITKNYKITTHAEYILKADTKITLQVGPSKIVMDNLGITISAPNKVDISGGLEFKASAMDATLSGGMTHVTGGMVKINSG